MRWVGFFIIVLSWAWISQKPKGPIILSPPPDMLSDVEMAMEIWNSHCPGMFKMGSGGVRFTIVEDLPHNHVGEFSPGRIRVLDGRPYLYMNTLAHEIGHAAGLPDMYQGTGVMYYVSTGLTRLSKQDIEEARKAGWKCL